MKVVGFIGLGNMGSGMVRRLHSAGYSLIIYDVLQSATESFTYPDIRIALCASELASESDVIFTSLPAPSDVDQVVTGTQGILEGIRKDSVYVDVSTNRPSLVRRLEPMFRGKGASMLDAPVSGGKSGAASGNLAVMVGGDFDVYGRVKPILDTIGDKVFYAGGIGAGSICKLVHNMISQVVQQAIAEGLTLGVKAGVEPQSLWECIRRGGMGRMTGLHEGVPRTVFRGEFHPPNFSMALARKDVGLATDLGREFSVPLPMGNLVEQIAIQCMNRGWGDMDASILFRLQEEMAGVEVRADGVDVAKSAQFISTHPEIT